MRSAPASAIQPKTARRSTPSRIDFATPARAGKLEALRRLTTSDDWLAYKWLHAAADAGHAVDAELAALRSPRDDAAGYRTAAAHWELACAYLEGADGLPIDVGLARRHLARAFERHDLASINEHTRRRYSPATLLLKLTGDAWQALETALVGSPG